MPTKSQPDAAVLNAVPIGLMLVGPDRTILFANTTFHQMFARSGFVGNDVSILRAVRLTEQIDAALHQRTDSTLEFTLTRAGDTALKAHIRAVPDGVLVAVEDETQRRRAEEVHRDFVANASHELKTPLAASSGIIETLLGHARDDPEASDRFLGLLQKQVQRMSGLINDLMSLNRIEMNARVQPHQALTLSEVIDETVDALSSVAVQADVTLEWISNGADVEVIGDREQLAQVFTNLIDNAIKYSGPGKRIQISTVPTQEPSSVAIAVRDQGIGIEREHLPRLTERFYRVNIRQSREAGGTGLGLAIVKHILNRHKGRLTVESEIGKGSTFTVLLPCEPGATGQDQAPTVTNLSQN